MDSNASVISGASCAAQEKTSRRVENDQEKTAGGASSLDLDKKMWFPGSEMPENWGTELGDCGKTVVAKTEGDRITYVPVLCKRWSCPVCGYYKYAWVVRNICENMERHDCTRLLTLTLKTGLRDAEQSFRDMKSYWALLRHAIRRKFGPFEFMWVIETTKAGFAHLHVLVNKFIPQPWLSGEWLRITKDSRVVHIERLQGKAAARYVAKYVSKEAKGRRTDGRLRGLHVFGKSEGITFDEFMPKAGEGGWKLVVGSWAANAEWLRRNCVLISDTASPTPRIVVRAVHGNDYLTYWALSPLGGRSP